MARPRHFVLLATLVAVCAASVSACSGDDGGGGGGESPSPTEPFPANRCQIVWSTERGALADVFQLDAPAGSWTTSSSHAFVIGTNGFQGLYREGFDVGTETSFREAVVTTGTFSLTSASLDPDQLIAFDNEVPRPLFLVDSAGGLVAFAGTGGTGNFTGFWSDPWSTNVVPGSGVITVFVEGTSRTLGSDLSYAVCYE